MKIKKSPAMRVKEENVLSKWIANAKDLPWKNFSLTRKPKESDKARFQYVRERKRSDNNLSEAGSIRSLGFY